MDSNKFINLYGTETDKEKLHFDIIYCDLDGTLMEDSERHYRCYEDIVKKYGGICISKEEYWQDKRNKINRTELLKKTQFQGTYQDYFWEWNKNIEKPRYLVLENKRNKADEILQWLRNHSDKMVLVSMRQNRQNLIKQLEQVQLNTWFDEIICGDATKGLKKAELVESQKGRFLVLGDTEADGELARKINAVWIAVVNGLRDEQYLEGADYYMEIR